MADSRATSGESAPHDQRLERLIAEGIDDDLFTGAAAAVGSSDGIEWETTAGERDPRSGDPVTADTRFDAASTTKAVVTATVVMRLVEEGVLALSAPIGEYVPPLSGTDRGEIPLHRFMTHTSGLQPYHYDDGWETPDDARQGIYDADLLAADPGERFEYSCLNYVHLVDATRWVTDRAFADLAREYVFDPAGMDRARMGPLGDDVPAAVTYERDHADAAFAGEIHDPIARAFAGESGNAGLFATATDLGRFAAELLAVRRRSAASRGAADEDKSVDRGRPADGDGPADSGGPADGGGRLLAPGTVDRMTRDWLPDSERPHGLGWRLARECYPAANWSLSSFGHTGYTGTSVWLDPEVDRFAVLLTNEVYCGKGDGMVRFRERFHGAVAGERY
ncbi:serine hydrolase domain-containing protein [Halosimplex marinum]|uniref:serine hydrolase domain-containing protein n=1 Tax=Halosimplex marinum TaxID=3396620 RepID=UPI003F57461D